MAETISQRTQSNLRRTRWVVMAAFVTNAFANLLLVAFLARRGGIEMVGSWALLNAILMNVLILDLGLTNALTFRIGRDGLAPVLPELRWVLRRAAGGGAGALVLCPLALALGANFPAAVALAVAAAIAQLGSNWLCTIRMGQHEQYWFNLLSILQVTTQTLIAVTLVVFVPGPAEFLFASALLTGALASLLAAFVLVRRDMSSGPANISAPAMRDLLAGFGLENLSQRAFQPLSQLLVSYLLGTVMLGIFTVALRIPVVINQSVSEALRALLPGLAAALRMGASGEVPRALRDALVTQLVLVVPTVSYVIVQAPDLLAVWIGNAPPEAVGALRLLSLAIAAVSVSVPFYWALHAAGKSRALAISGAVRLGAVLLVGALAMAHGAGLIGFVSVLALGQVGHATVCLILAQRHDALLSRSLRGIRFVRLAAFLAGAVVLNLGLGALLGGMGGAAARFGLASLANALAIGLPGLLALHRHWFVLGTTEPVERTGKGLL